MAMMPQELYLQLNNTFARVREAEREATRLEREAMDLRNAAQQDVRALYNVLNAADITLQPVKEAK